MKIINGIGSIALMAISGYAIAAWTPVESTRDMEVYFDRSSIARDGGIATVWVLYNHHSVQTEAGDSYLSSKGQWEIDCRRRAIRQIFHAIYPGEMGSGRTIWAGPLNRNFQPIVPGTISESVSSTVCR